MRRANAGFTLMEAMVACVLTAIGIVGTLRGISAIEHSQSTLTAKERMHRLAVEKFQEIQSLQDFTTPNGDFTDRNENRYLWTMQVNPVTLPSTAASTTPATATQTNNAGQLQSLTVTVHPTSSSEPSQSESVSGLVWESPQTLNGVSAQ